MSSDEMIVAGIIFLMSAVISFFVIRYIKNMGVDKKIEKIKYCKKCGTFLEEEEHIYYNPHTGRPEELFVIKSCPYCQKAITGYFKKRKK